MSKFYGAIGYVITEDIGSGVYKPKTFERMSYGDMLSNSRRMSNSNTINGDITIQNKLSIIADPYSLVHLESIKYVEWLGVKWTVESIEVNAPRLFLTLGGVYNGEQT